MEKTKNETIRTDGSLTWQERKKIVKEFLTGNYTKVALWKKYTGQEEKHGQILLGCVCLPVRTITML